MDELEISGKRYISTRRAGKEHKYHSDYIGQLIRGGKVAGQKVGRSWYVDADSLAEYLGNEAGSKSLAKPFAKVPVTKITPIVNSPAIESPVEEIQEEEPEEAAPQVEIANAVEEKVEEIFEQEIEREVPIQRAVPISMHVTEIKKESPVIRTRSSLRYIADDSPLYPHVQTTPKIKMRIAEPEQIEEEVREEREETVYVEEERVTILEHPKKKKSIASAVRLGGMVLVAGVLAVGIAVGMSALVTSNTTVEEKTATVNYSLSLPK